MVSRLKPPTPWIGLVGAEESSMSRPFLTVITRAMVPVRRVGVDVSPDHAHVLWHLLVARERFGREAIGASDDITGGNERPATRALDDARACRP